MLKSSICNPRRNSGLAAFLLLTVLSLPVLMTPVVMTAQTFLGSVVGTISDTTGASVPGAKVTVTNTGTNEEHAATTSNSGDYQLLNLIPGSYRMTVEKEGFSKLVRD